MKKINQTTCLVTLLWLTSVSLYSQTYIYLDETFRGKAVCNALDTFDKKEGMIIAFDTAMEKRTKKYDKIIRSITNDFLSMKHDSYKIADKFRKLLRK